MQKMLAIILSILIALFLLSVSVAGPVLIRQIFYTQVDSLHLPEKTGYSRETIIHAYDEMMDYCTGGGERAGRTFGTGTLAWSETGKAHFDDVERVFHLDFMIAVITGALLAAYLLSRLVLPVRKKRLLQSYRFLGRGPLFWGPSLLFGIFGILTVAAVLDFEGFFVWFHHVVFPGKENWLLDRDTDEIIRILPYDVLQTFGLIIIGLLLAGCVICILADFILRRSRRSE